MRRALASLLFVALVIATPAFLAGAAPRTAAPEPAPEDLRARSLFQEHRYADALVIYTQLYARTQHPTYLRNIGRCHQMLREPEPAISHFRAYLHDAHDVSAEERVEIEGYIREMEALQHATARDTSGAPPAAVPAAPEPPAAGSPVLASEPPARETPLTHRWWFWTAIGAVVVGGVVTAVLIASQGPSRLPCPMDAVCP
ncbi:MAG: hypothetical protein ACJ8F1_17610 [Polyangia bacterium]